jgi:hypothetical protein
MLRFASLSECRERWFIPVFPGVLEHHAFVPTCKELRFLTKISLSEEGVGRMALKIETGFAFHFTPNCRRDFGSRERAASAVISMPATPETFL